MSTCTARLAIGTALQLGKTFLAVTFVLAFAVAFAFDLFPYLCSCPCR